MGEHVDVARKKDQEEENLRPEGYFIFSLNYYLRTCDENEDKCGVKIVDFWGQMRTCNTLVIK